MTRALMVMSLLSVDPQPPPQPPATCTFVGKVVLKSDGKPADDLSGVVVFVDGPKDVAHEAQTHEIIQHDRQFNPPMKVVHTGDTIAFINRDKYPHDVYSANPLNTFYSSPSKMNVTEKRQFKFAGPVRIGCQLHKFMRADVLVLENGWYDANVQPDGTFTVKGVPAAPKVKLAVWERNGTKVSVEVKGCSGTTQVPPIELEEAGPPPDVDPGGLY